MIGSGCFSLQLVNLSLISLPHKNLYSSKLWLRNDGVFWLGSEHHEL